MKRIRAIDEHEWPQKPQLPTWRGTVAEAIQTCDNTP